MGDITKWILLAAIAVTCIGMICAFPIIGFIDLSIYASAINSIVSVASNAFRFGRGLLNNLLSPWARNAVSGLMLWLIGKWLITYTLRVSVWVYHWIFK